MSPPDAGVKRTEPLDDLHILLPKSLGAWVRAEARRRELSVNAYIRTHFAALKERAEANKA